MGDYGRRLIAGSVGLGVVGGVCMCGGGVRIFD